jgi:hypothetical protein
MMTGREARLIAAWDAWRFSTDSTSEMVTYCALHDAMEELRELPAADSSTMTERCPAPGDHMDTE